MFCGLYFPPPFGVPMVGPMPVPWWPLMVAVALAMALSGLFFLSLILFPVQAHWMLAMALSGLFSWA